MAPRRRVHIVGLGLAGCEAAWVVAAHAPEDVDIFGYEQRPKSMTPAHRTGRLGELVCSNSLKSLRADSAPGLLKEEMTTLGSVIIPTAQRTAVPAGQALAVDREAFSKQLTESLHQHPRLRIIERKIGSFEDLEGWTGDTDNDLVIFATGPLTDTQLAERLRAWMGCGEFLSFYDAIAPVLDGDTIEWSQVYWGNRYGEPGTGDYVNIPLEREEYHAFVQAIQSAEKVPLHSFESTPYFEACLPIEVMVERGPDTLRFGPMKPVGLRNPRTGRTPYAVVQLRRETRGDGMFSMVGFQTKMTWPEQGRVFRLLPGLGAVEFLRLGSVHRNTFVHGPRVLRDDLSLKALQHVYLAGQITGVEGYTESSAIGLLVGWSVVSRLRKQHWIPPPPTTMLGALHRHVTCDEQGSPYQPMNANFGLLPPLAASTPGAGSSKKLPKDVKRSIALARARTDLRSYVRTFDHIYAGVNVPEEAAQDVSAVDLVIPDPV